MFGTPMVGHREQYPFAADPRFYSKAAELRVNKLGFKFGRLCIAEFCFSIEQPKSKTVSDRR